MKRQRSRRKKEAKEYLERISAINIHIDKKIDELKELETKATKVTSTIGYDRVQTSADDKMADSVIKIVELKEYISEQLDRFVKLKKEAEDVVNQIMVPDYVEIIYDRYFRRYSFKHIAANIGKTEQWVYELHDRALGAVADILQSRKN